MDRLRGLWTGIIMEPLLPHIFLFYLLLGYLTGRWLRLQPARLGLSTHLPIHSPRPHHTRGSPRQLLQDSPHWCCGSVPLHGCDDCCVFLRYGLQCRNVGRQYFAMGRGLLGSRLDNCTAEALPIGELEHLVLHVNSIAELYCRLPVGGPI
jgi:hypothetical protein